MVEIGKLNTLRVKGEQAYGLHLDGGAAGDILLRNKYVQQRLQTGDEIEVFVFVDREGTLQATTQKPYVCAGQYAVLQVVACTGAGAYLDWGLDHDLFVPKSEQQNNMVKGKSYVVYVFVSEQNNGITASSKLMKFLSTLPPDFTEGEEVDLIIYEKTAMGYGALVNQSHVGIVYGNEVFQDISVGQQVKGYIKKIREDLKIDLSLQRSGYQQIDDISQAIFTIIQKRGGKVNVTDKSPPDDIYALFGVSKKVFKKAIGGLYKKRLVVLDGSGITVAK